MSVRSAPITDGEFTTLMETLAPFESHATLAVAVSGGQDSMALAFLTERWCRHHQCHMEGLIVDHGLQAASARQAKQTKKNLQKMKIKATILTASIEAGGNVQMRARNARYRLLEDYCERHDILHLLVAHHDHDQSETLLLRLARGSGVYGLAAMTPCRYGRATRLLRPLLAIARSRLHATIKHHAIAYVKDDSNDDSRFARVRLRQHEELLNELMPRTRLSDTTRRLRRARKALEHDCATAAAATLQVSPLGCVMYHRCQLLSHSEEIHLRLLSSVLQMVGGRCVMPRLENVLALRDAIMNKESRTLHGCVITRLRGQWWIVYREVALIKESCNLPKGDPTLWDNRFELLSEASVPSSVVRPLRQRGWHAIKHHDLPRLPADIFMSLPALWNKNHELLCVPSLDIVLHSSDCYRTVTARFQPVRTVT